MRDARIGGRFRIGPIRPNLNSDSYCRCLRAVYSPPKIVLHAQSSELHKQQMQWTLEASSSSRRSETTKGVVNPAETQPDEDITNVVSFLSRQNQLQRSVGDPVLNFFSRLARTDSSSCPYIIDQRCNTEIQVEPGIVALRCVSSLFLYCSFLARAWACQYTLRTRTRRRPSSC